MTIPLGRMLGWGYWYLDCEAARCYLSDYLRSLYGLPPGGNEEDYSDARTRMWDDEMAEVLDRCLEISRMYRIKFKLPLQIRDTTGRQRLHFNVGYLLFRPGEEIPYAMYGWTKEIQPSKDSEAALTTWRGLAKLRNKGALPPEMKILSHHYAHR